MTVYEAIEQPDGTFELSSVDREELLKKYSSTQILTALLKVYEIAKSANEIEVNGDLPPCQDCSDINFTRTGNCYVCMTCGASQGCS